MPIPRTCVRHPAAAESGRHDAVVLAAAVPLAAATWPLLRRMRCDLLQRSRLRTSTAAWMWAGYAAFAALTATALTATPPVPPPRSPVRAAGVVLTAAGGALDVAAMRRFTGPAQLTGTAAGELVTGGVYRYSRHPQYSGLVTALLGVAVLRRSPAVAALTVGLATVYRAWAGVEEDHLARHFGQPYRAYRDRTPRWLGLPGAVAPTRPHTGVPAEGA